MTKMSDAQKESRKRIREELNYLYECLSLDRDDSEYCSIETFKEIIQDIPTYDLTEKEKQLWLDKIK